MVKSGKTENEPKSQIEIELKLAEIWTDSESAYVWQIYKNKITKWEKYVHAECGGSWVLFIQRKSSKRNNVIPFFVYNYVINHAQHKRTELKNEIFAPQFLFALHSFHYSILHWRSFELDYFTVFKQYHTFSSAHPCTVYSNTSIVVCTYYYRDHEQIGLPISLHRLWSEQINRSQFYSNSN